MASSNNMLQPQLPRFNGKNYHQWSIQMKVLYESQDMWSIVENGVEEPANVATLSTQQLNDLKEVRKKDKKALYFIYQSVDEVIFERISSCTSAKEAWDTLHTSYRGEEKVKLVKLQTLRCDFDNLKMKDAESIEDYFNRIVALVNQMRLNGEDVGNRRVVEKILRSLPLKFEHIVAAIEESKDLSTLSVESLLGSLQSHELRMKQRDPSPIEHAFQSQVSLRGGASRGRGRGRQFFRGRGRSNGGGDHEKTNEGEKGESSNRGRGRGRPLSQMQCYHCQRFGHTAKYCRKKLAEEAKESTFLHATKDDDTMFLACDVQETPLNEVWYIDSGCSNHMTGNKEMFITLDASLQSEVRTGDDKRLSVQGCGDILVKTKKGVKRIPNVFYVPGLKHNLLSVGQLLKKGHDVHFKGEVCEIRDKDHTLLGKVNMTPNKMFPLKFQNDVLPCFSTIVKDKSWLWHLRFGHLNFNSLSYMCKNKMVRGMPYIDRVDQVCEGCALGKHSRDSFESGKVWRASNPLELIHSDLCGPMRTTSIGGSRYVLIFIDDFSRKTWVYFLKEKSETFGYFKIFKALVEKQSGFMVKSLRSDRGGEYISHEFQNFLKENGIRHQLTTRYTPQQNGVAERKNRTIMEAARSMLKAKGMPNSYWAEAVACAVYLLNRASLKSVQGMTSQEAWSGHKPCVSHLRVFGSIAYAHIPDEGRSKLDDKSEKCIFVGYSEHSKAYKLYNPITKKTIISRDVMFNEEESWDWAPGDDKKKSIVVEEESNAPSDGNNVRCPPSPPSSPGLSSSSSSSSESSPSPPKKIRSLQEVYNNTQQIELADFALFADADPVDFDEAIREDKWKKAMDQEIQSIEKNKTWELMELPNGHNQLM